MLERAKVNNNIKNREELSTGWAIRRYPRRARRVVHRSVAAQGRSACVLPKGL